MMKELFKKNWFIGVLIIGIMLLIFLLNLWVMSMKFVGFYSLETFWTIGDTLVSGSPLLIFVTSIEIAFYLSIVAIAFSLYSLIRKNNWGIITTILYFLGFETTLIISQTLNHYLSGFAFVLIVLSIVLSMGIVVLMILRMRLLSDTEEPKKETVSNHKSNTKISFLVMLIDIIAILGFLTIFFIPLYTLNGTNITTINVLLSSDTNIHSIAGFFVEFAFFLAILFYFSYNLSHYFFDKNRFVNQSKVLIHFAFFTTILFFIAGLTLNIYYAINGSVASTVSYIPSIIMIFITFIYAILRGKYYAVYKLGNKELHMKYPRIEALAYVFIITAVTFLMLFLPIVNFHITAGAYTYDVNLTGFAILRDYPSLDTGYRFIAFILVLMLISVGLGLVIAVTSYLSKYGRFNGIVRTVTSINVFFVFIVAISGFYFQIAQQINQTAVQAVADFYGIQIPSQLEYTYKINTYAIYALLASVLVVILMFLRKSFDKDHLEATTEDLLALGANPSLGSESTSTSENELLPNSFDPSPALTELDQRMDEFKQDLSNRKKLKVKEASLNSLVNFVVEYARDSKLHLSYTVEDIATFVAGLGASRLSILQGMSGTGKTSLPKIFSEAIFGNCEIIEVESSWKDKNELLGYYNEFSTKYTPKKFTLALYKAALNPEIFTFILLDEMNLSRIEYYFSDFLSLMENEEHLREIKLVNIKLSRIEEENQVDYLALTNGHTLKVPSNVWFIGTANRDESTFVISDKVYDRAHTMNFTKRAPKVRNFKDPIPKQYYDYQTINELFEKAKKEGTFDAEKSEIIKSVEVLLAPFNISFGNRILKQIEDFVNIYQACFGDQDVEKEAVEKILLSKVVAKLEVKTIDDKEKLELEFEKLKLHQCLEFIKRLDNE